MTTTTRHLRSYGPEHIYIDGITRGPSVGWSWNGATLVHPTGIRMVMAPAAAKRIADAIAAYKPPIAQRLVGIQIQELPAAERDEWIAGLDHATRSDDKYNGWSYGGYITDDGVAVYARVDTPVAGECDFDVSEVVEITRGR